MSTQKNEAALLLVVFGIPINGNTKFLLNENEGIVRDDRFYPTPEKALQYMHIGWSAFKSWRKPETVYHDINNYEQLTLFKFFDMSAG